MDEDYLADTNLHPRVRDALARGGQEAFGSPPTLNFGNIQAAHPAARLLTQAVSRVVYEDPRSPAGIRYISRHTDNEECWAVFANGDRTSAVHFRPVDRLDATSTLHRRAVQDAARLLRVLLPDVWGR
jgi:hypothetical protein